MFKKRPISPSYSPIIANHFYLVKTSYLSYNLNIKRSFYRAFLIYVYMEKTKQILDKKALAEIKTQLLAQKKKITADLATMSRRDNHESDDRSAKFPEYGDKPDENAQEISDYTTNVATEKVLEKTLEDINKALERIEKGNYGICKYCGNSIAEKRLLARPTAGACMNCKTELQENA